MRTNLKIRGTTSVSQLYHLSKQIFLFKQKIRRLWRKASLTRSGYDYWISTAYIPCPDNGGNSVSATLTASQYASHFALQLQGPFNFVVLAWFTPFQALWAAASKSTIPLHSISYCACKLLTSLYQVQDHLSRKIK